MILLKLLILPLSCCIVYGSQSSEDLEALHSNPVDIAFWLNAPCSDSPPEFREAQCAVFDNFSYQGFIYEWMPFDDDDEPCALICKGKPEGSDGDAVRRVARLRDKVHDGTRCRPGSLDMCIDGRCQRVCCDPKTESTKQVDECGECGGDGSTCPKPLYQWTMRYRSLCSTCIDGYKMLSPVCQNRVTEDKVEDELCNDTQRPDPAVMECTNDNCPTNFIPDEWGPCSVTCGDGVRRREVHCKIFLEFTRVIAKLPDRHCSRIKPVEVKKCYREPCTAEKISMDVKDDPSNIKVYNK